MYVLYKYNIVSHVFIIVLWSCQLLVIDSVFLE